jgi:hypothetical protein
LWLGRVRESHFARHGNTVETSFEKIHRQKIAKASIARRTPSDGLKTAKQKEKSQPECWAIGFVFIVLSKAFEDQHFTNT